MIGQRLKEKIGQLGMTQQQAADKLGISQSRLNQYLKDRREPDGQMLCHICEVLGVTPNWLFGFDGDTPAQSIKINKQALETAVRLFTGYTVKSKKTYTPEQTARIIAVIYDIIMNESEDKAMKTIEWIVEAVA